MKRVAVIAHRAKVLGDGLPALRRALAEAGIDDPIWHEVPKSKKAPKWARRAAKEGADLVLVWGGDGMVQRCLDALAGRDVTIGILPAGTANLLATNLGIPHDLEDSLRTALDGAERRIDVGVVNGERFAVMAGAGFDARMIDGADGEAKEQLGRLAYVRAGIEAMRTEGRRVRIRVDGAPWFKGKATCVLVGNVGTASGGLEVFPDAVPDDGLLDVGVVTAEGMGAWLRVLSRAARKRPEQSRFVSITKARSVDMRFDEPWLYEMDGGTRKKAKRLRFSVEPLSVTVRVPA